MLFFGSSVCQNPPKNQIYSTFEKKNYILNARKLPFSMCLYKVTKCRLHIKTLKDGV